MRQKHHYTGANVGQPQSWYSFSSGFSGVVYGVSFTQNHKVRVECYIDMGNTEKNKHLFDWLQKQQTTLQNQIDQDVKWERLDGKRASRIAVYRDGSILSDTPTLDAVERWCIQNLLLFRNVFDPYLKQYKQHNGLAASMTI
jgi:hypothetical protein